MLANRLSQFEIRADIAEDAAMELRSARYVYSTDCVYIHPDGADTVCENGGDRIVLCRMDPAQAYELIQDTFDFYRRWEQGLRQAREDGDYRRIIRKSYLLFHAPVMLIDYNTRLLACTEEFRNQPVDAEWDHYMAHGCASLAGQQSIQRMKDGVILVNTSRGGLIKTDDLIAGIRENKFFGVGLDVYEEETPNVFENREDEILMHSTTARLLSFPNVIVTSHQGFFTDEALEAIATTTLNNAMAYLKGEKAGTELN